MKERIEIPLSKTKLAFLLIAAIIFVVFSVWFIVNPETFVNNVFQDVALVRIVGIVGAAFFGLGMVVIGKKVVEDKAGLIIDDQGITDNSNAASVGLIEWADITKIREISIATNKMLMLDTNQPEKYINRAKNGLIKRTMQTNHKMYGSPLSIAPSSLKINFKELKELVINGLDRNGK